MTKGELFNLNATNGECIVDLNLLTTTSRFKLHSVEELGDEYIRTKNYTSVWIPVVRTEFWSMIKAICDKSIDMADIGENAKREFEMISQHIEKLIKQLED